MKTLSEFIVERQAEYPNAKGELSGILSSIRLLAKIIHRDINKAGLTNILGQSGVENVQGESQMKLALIQKKKKVSLHLIPNTVVMPNMLF